MKSDEKSISAIASQAHNAEADKRTLQKKLAASERRVQDLEKRLVDLQTASDEKVRNLTDQLSQEMSKVSSMVQQLVDYMMGKGDVSLTGTIRDTVVEGIREEVRKGELQMRKIAIYRNNSFFLGSVKSAKRFARLISLVQSAKNCKRNVQKYFHDTLNSVMVTAKEDLVSILPHKWVEPVTIPLVY